MIRWKFTYDKDREEAWLNDYCQQGWAMVSFFVGVVTFVPCQPGEYIYQIDLLPGSGLRASNYEEYRSFMEEMGVEVVQRWGRWVYLRKRAEDGPFEIYTDVDSQLEMYRRIRKMFVWALVVECCCIVSPLHQTIVYADLFLRCMVALLALMILVLVGAVVRCSRRIEELECQKR